MEVPAPSAPTPSPVGPERLGPGTRLGHFELLECVGGGGMGRVFRARDTALGRIVAVKVLSREQATDDEVLLRFRNEAQTGARLNHENIVQVYHIGEEAGLPYIVSEFIEGLNLRALVEQKGVLPLAEAVSYTFQIAEALTQAAAHHVVHRDIKPSNVLITAQGQAKLIDLGLARLTKPADGAADLTASGVTLGTFDYISPEQARDPRTADVRSDLYSLGCTLFFMLAGRPPFAQGTVLQKLLQHQGEEPPDVRQFRPELPPDVSRLLRKMMAKDPRRRFQNPQQLIAAMAMLAEHVGLHPAGPGEKSWVPDRQRPISALQQHLPWLAPSAILIVAVIALDFFWSSPTPRGENPSRWLGEVAATAGKTADQPASPLPQDSAATAASVRGTGQDVPPGQAAPESSPGEPKTASPAPRSDNAGSAASGTPAAAASAPGKQPETASTAPLAEAPAKPPISGELRPEATEGQITLSHPSTSGALAATGTSAAPPTPNDPSLAGSRPPAATSPGPAAGSKGIGAGVLVVDPSGQGPNRFPSLEAACAAATTGDAIELRYNGRAQEPPLAIRNLKLTVRAADGCQPVVVFRSAGPDPVKYPRAMLALSGAQLTLVNVAVELEIPREVASEQWSLFEIRQAEQVRLEKCSLTIRNNSDQLGAYHPDVAFFRVKSGPRAGSLIDGEAGAPPRRVTIALVDCILRGEAVVLRALDQWPIQFSWENGLLLTTEQLLAADGGERIPAPGENIQLDLQHVTAVVRGGLCRFNQGPSGPRLLSTQVTCANTILVGGPTAPLVEHAGVPASDTGRPGFAWNGDRNFYEGFTSFWTIRRAGDPMAAAEVMSFDAWRALWGPRQENLPSVNRVQWLRLPAAERPVHALDPSDYTLNAASASANPALGAANDGRDAGCLGDRRLPQLPSSPQVPAMVDKPASVEPRGAQPKPQ